MLHRKLSARHRVAANNLNFSLAILTESNDTVNMTTNLIRYLSIERLSTFVTLTGSQTEAIALHQETLRLGTLLMTVLAQIEITLRNAICEQLDSHFSGTAWLLAPPTSLVWAGTENFKIKDAEKNARRAIYSKLTQHQKRALDAIAFPSGIPASLSGKIGHKKIVASRQKSIAVSMGQIISQLTFFFWKRLYSTDYDQVLWQPLKRLFPNKQLKRADIAVQLETLYQCRNRIAHHEPVYGRRLIETIDAIDFFVANFDGVDADGDRSINKLLANDLALLKTSANSLQTKINSFKSVP